MNCTCPKCTSIVEIDQSLISEKGKETTCTDCTNRFWVYRESFAARANKTQGRIYCAHCGSALGSSIVCSSCGALYPDIIVSQSTKPVRRRQARTPRRFSISWPASRRSQARKPKIAIPKKSTGTTSRIRKYLIGASSLVVLLAVGTALYLHHQEKELYSKNYMRALYGIKSGIDTSFGAFNRIVQASRKIGASGREAALRFTTSEKERSQKIKFEVDRLIAVTKNPPKKYATSNEKLVSLYTIYSNAYELSNNPSDSVETLYKKSQKLERDFTDGMRELEASLPKELSLELEKARKKYRAL
ncbi:MAG TPA: hypothetical protein PLI53_00505 [Geobacteraceae bacterium]|nr:hypothetical protein [Geobacteraceae bacterium]